MNIHLNKTVEFQNLGLIDYQQAWDYQEELFRNVIGIKTENRNLSPESQEITPNYLLFCQHPHVFTLGKSGKEEHLLISQQQLDQHHASFYKINRGGDITYHGPGQLVGYPILDLDNFFTDIHKYMRLLEEAIILTLAEFGIKAGRIAGLTGVWIDFEDQIRPRKICAMGVKSSRWVTMHGFALNINTDLSWFTNIVPCGIDDKAVTSVESELGMKVPMERIAEVLKNKIGLLFEMNLVDKMKI
jgi:lipoyl(octanoyl) transferase